LRPATRFPFVARPISPFATAPVALNQDIVEAKVSLVVDKQKGVDFGFTSKELTLNINELSERVIKPAMVQLANQIDSDVYGLYKYVPNWVGTPGTTVDLRRLRQGAAAHGRICRSARRAFRGPQSRRPLGPAWRPDRPVYPGRGQGRLSRRLARQDRRRRHVHGAEPSGPHRGSDMSGTVGASITTSTTDYATVKNTMQQTITTASLTLNPGDVFTIASVNDVNPVTKADLGRLKQFVCISHSANTLVMYPAMIWTGAFKNVAVASGTTDLNGNAITGVGTANDRLSSEPGVPQERLCSGDGAADLASGRNVGIAAVVQGNERSLDPDL
jgi:hypothetical protein